MCTRKFAFMAVLFLLVTSVGFGMHLGAPVPTLKDGELSVGAVYWVGETEFTFGDGLSADVDIEAAQVMLDYGLIDGVTIFGRFGGGRQTVEGLSADALVCGLGFKTGFKLKADSPWGVGLAAGVGTTNAKYDPGYGDVAFDTWAAQVAALVEYESGWLTVYAGPMWQMEDVDVSWKTGESKEGLDIRTKLSSEKNDAFGGLAGACIQAPWNLQFVGEYSWAGPSQNLSTGLVYRF